MFFADTQIVPAAQDILKAVWGYCPFNKETVDGGYQKLEQGLGYLNKELERKKFLIGESVTLADVIVGETLGFIYQYILDEKLRSQYPELTKYFLAYREIHEVKEVNGPVVLAKKLPEVGDSR